MELSREMIHPTEMISSNQMKIVANSILNSGETLVTEYDKLMHHNPSMKNTAWATSYTGDWIFMRASENIHGGK